MEVTVRDHWRRCSRIPAPRPNGLRRSVGARVGRTRCERSGHRRSAPGLHASPATDPAAVLRGFPQPAHRRVRRRGSCVIGAVGPAGACRRTHACVLRGGNRHRALPRACASSVPRGLVVATGAWRAAVVSGFHTASTPPRQRHSRRRCGCVALTGTDRSRGDSHRVGRRRIDAVRGIDTSDSASSRWAAERQPARNAPAANSGCVTDAATPTSPGRRPRKRSRVSGGQHWRCHGCGE